MPLKITSAIPRLVSKTEKATPVQIQFRNPKKQSAKKKAYEEGTVERQKTGVTVRGGGGTRETGSKEICLLAAFKKERTYLPPITK